MKVGTIDYVGEGAHNSHLVTIGLLFSFLTMLFWTWLQKASLNRF